MSLKTLVFIPDAHIVSVNDYDDLHPALRLVIRFIHEYRPEVVVFGGDFLDMRAINPHALKGQNWKELEMQRLADDYALGRKLIESMIRRAEEAQFLEGNHCNWAVQLMEKLPGLTGLLDVRANLYLDDMGVGWTDVNKVWSYGKLNFTHGWYVNKYHARKHLDEMGDHLFYCHTHDHQKHLKPVRASREPYVAMSMGCLCSKNPYYLRNKPNQWVNGFGLFEIGSDGNFSPHFIPIINRSFIWGRYEWRI